ncbi:MAG: hypothetical protein AAB465_03475 [Patescibacteria group bacterium]
MLINCPFCGTLYNQQDKQQECSTCHFPEDEAKKRKLFIWLIKRINGSAVPVTITHMDNDKKVALQKVFIVGDLNGMVSYIKTLWDGGCKEIPIKDIVEMKICLK